MDRVERNLSAISKILSIVCAFAFAGSAFAGVNEWTKIGPEGGQIYQIVYHRTTPSTMYAMASSGFHRSSDGGLTWRLTPIEIFPGPFEISLDPSHPDRFYCVTYRRRFVSTDRGATFQSVPQPQGVILDDLNVAIDGTLYSSVAGTPNLYRSSDQGQNWVASTAPRGSLLLDPTNAATLYSMVKADGIYVSTNSGVNWTRHADMTTLDNLQFLKRVLIDPQTPNRWWALASNKILFSSNRGVNWSEVYAGSNSSSDWPVALAFSPNDSSLVYIALLGGRLLSTSDQGAHWIPAGDRRELLSHFAINPLQPTEMTTAGLSGLAVGSVGSTTWTSRNSGLISTFASRFVPGGSGRTYFVSNSGVFFLQGDTVNAVNNVGLLQVARQTFDIQGFLYPTLLIPPSAQNTLYLADDSRLYKSVDAGANWSALPYIPKQVWGFAGSRLDAQVLYVGSYDGAIKSVDGGITWNSINNGLPAYEPPPSMSQTSYIYSLATGNNPSIVYAGTMGAGVYKSINAGQSWTAANNGIADKRVYTIKIDPTDDQTLYAATIPNDNSARSIAKSTDGGATWTNVLTHPDMNFWGIAIDPSNPKIIVVSGDERVFRSVDAGATWQTLREASVIFRSAGLNYSILDPQRPDVVLVGSGIDGVQQFTVAPDLQINIAPPSSLNRGAAASYSLNVANSGPWDATDIRVTVQLPSTVTAVSFTGATCATGSGAWTCTLSQLKSAASTTIALRLTPDSTGPLQIDASVTGAQSDSKTSNNSATSSTLVAEPASTSGGGSSSGGGGSFAWTLSLLLTSLAVGANYRRRSL